jgi:Uma2 family endonuclease
MGLPQRVAALTPAEYLRIERAALYRSAYFAGEMFAMAGGSPRHSLIKTNLLGELRSALKGRPCTAYHSDLRICISATGLYTYPDASVICDELQFDDEQQDTVLNLTLLVEVCPRAARRPTAARNSTITPRFPRCASICWFRKIVPRWSASRATRTAPGR